MKKHLVILLALLFVSFLNSFGQSKLTEQEVKSLLCHKWKAVSMETQGEQLDAEDEEIFLSFLPNGTFIDSQDSEYMSDNKWTYSHNTMTVTTGGIPKQILKLDDKQLKLKAKMDGETTVITLIRVN